MKRALHEPWFAPAVALAALALAAGLRHEGFVSMGVAVSILDDGAMLGLAALGAAVAIASGGIDLSIGAVAALASLVVAGAVERLGLAPPLAIALALAAGTAFGAAQGRAIDLAGLPPFVVTLGGMFLARGIALAIHVQSLPIEVAAWRAVARAELPGLGLDAAASAWLALAGALAWGFRNARTLRAALAVGGDERTALYFGVPMARTKSAVYAISGACAATSGVALALYASKGDSTAGVGLELDAIAAAVIGGTSLRGGRVSVLGAVLGAALLSLIRTALDFEGIGGAGVVRVALGALLLAFFVIQRAAGSCRSGAAASSS